MVKKTILLIGVTLMAGVIGGCVNGPELSDLLSNFFNSPDKEIEKTYLKKGRDYEDKGELVNALTQYNLALTVNANEQKAIDGRERVEKALTQSASAHYKKGLELDRQGKYGKARQQFLIALRLQPNYPEVTEKLTSRKRFEIKRYIVHQIHSGETLSGIAKLYYSDPQHFPLIAKYNNIADVTHIRVGQEIKIPELAGVKFSKEHPFIEPEEEIIFEPGLWDWEESLLETGTGKKEEKPEAKKEETAEMDKVASYRDKGVELFQEKKYQEAITEFKRVLDISPDDEVALDYSYRSYFNMGLSFFEKEDYLSARTQFEESLRYNFNCLDCLDYIKKCESLYMDAHYKMGMQYYGNEQLVEAMREWELVQLMDPNYKKVNHLVNKAKTILKKLEEIRESEAKKQ